jgi:hypothetical protein
VPVSEMIEREERLSHVFLSLLLWSLSSIFLTRTARSLFAGSRGRINEVLYHLIHVLEGEILLEFFERISRFGRDFNCGLNH